MRVTTAINENTEALAKALDTGMAWEAANDAISDLMRDPSTWDADQEVARNHFTWEIHDAHAEMYVTLRLRGAVIIREHRKTLADTLRAVAATIRERLDDD